MEVKESPLLEELIQPTFSEPVKEPPFGEVLENFQEPIIEHVVEPVKEPTFGEVFENFQEPIPFEPPLFEQFEEILPEVPIEKSIPYVNKQASYGLLDGKYLIRY